MRSDQATHNETFVLAQRVALEVIARRAEGVAVDIGAIIAEHAGLMPELAEQLRAVDLIARARSRASDAEVDADDGSSVAPVELPRLPGYAAVRRLKSGGQGVVFEAVQEGTGRRCAIKVMRSASLDAHDGRPLEAWQRFDREARVLGRLAHPNIVGILGRGEIEGRPFLVTDYIDGLALDDYITSREPPLRERMGLAARVCRAVQEAHVRAIIHRDLKPSNILVDDGGEPHVIDFGLARVMEPASPEHRGATATGQFVGSIAWASPEQARGAGGEEPVDLRSDVYALGLIAYFAATGALPYDTSGPTALALTNIVRAEPRSPRAVDRRIPRDLEAVILKALRKEPRERYQSAGELAEDLEAWLGHLPVRARPPTLASRAAVFVRRNRLAVAAGVIVALALMVGSGVALWQAHLAGVAARAALESAASSRRISEFYARTFRVADHWTFEGMLHYDDAEPAKMEEILRDAAKRVGEAFADRPDLAAKVRLEIARAMSSRFMYDDLAALLVTGLPEARVALGESDPALLEMEFLGLARDRAHLDRLIGDADRFVARAAAALGPTHALTLRARASVAWSYGEACDLLGAEQRARSLVLDTAAFTPEDDGEHLHWLVDRGRLHSYGGRLQSSDAYEICAYMLADRLGAAGLRQRNRAMTEYVGAGFYNRAWAKRTPIKTRAEALTASLAKSPLRREDLRASYHLAQAVALAEFNEGMGWQPVYSLTLALAQAGKGRAVGGDDGLLLAMGLYRRHLDLYGESDPDTGVCARLLDGIVAMRAAVGRNAFVDAFRLD